MFFKAVWYLPPETGGFDNWYDALRFMLEEIKKIDFDIALLGCGPFSMFIALDIKRNEK